MLFLVFLALGSCGRQREPDQPLPFSHRLHVADRQIPCAFCHRYADRSPVAGIPTVELCVNCHAGLVGTGAGVQKLLEHWERRQPIRWFKAYDLPDHVYFTHRMHLRAGLACATCHGDVASMDRIVAVADLSMGWCLGCHRRSGGSTDCLACHK